MPRLVFRFMLVASFFVPISSRAQGIPEGCPKANFNYRYIEVPVSADRPELGRFVLHYHISKDYDPKLPTIIAVNDAQAMPMAAVADGAKSKYPGANFIGVELRGGPCSPVALPGLAGADIDWKLAYEVFRSENVLNDYEAVRKGFFGDKPASIYGGSGGGIMAYQYLAKYGQHVKGAFLYTATADVNSMGARDKSNFLRVIDAFGVTQPLAEQVFAKEPEKPRLYRIIDQEIKQHSPANTALPQLFSQLQSGDRTLFNELLTKYGDWEKFSEIIAKAPSIAVRFFEIYPYREAVDQPKFPSHPGAVGLQKITSPLMSLADKGTIPTPHIDVTQQVKHFKGRFMGIIAEWDDVVAPDAGVASCRSISNAQCIVMKDTHLFASSRTQFEAYVQDFFQMRRPQSDPQR